MPKAPKQASDIKLLDSFYLVFLILGVAFLFIGVPFVFYRKLVSAILCIALIAGVLVAWRMSRGGEPQRSLKIFSVMMWLILVGLIFYGLPPITISTAVAIAVMLCVVVNIRAGVVFIATYMLAWGVYIALRAAGMAPAAYFIDRPVVSWFIGVFAIWLVLLPIPGLIGTLRRSLSLQWATIDATADGILVISSQGDIEIFNRRFVEMWNIPEHVLASRKHANLLNAVVDKLEDPEQFSRRIKEIYSQPEVGTQDILILKDGRIVERSTYPQRMDGKVVGRVLSFRDVTERKSTEEEIRNLAFYDSLTHLPNRRMLMDRLRLGLTASAGSGRDGALMFIDLDNFKILNDTMGHDNGDELLRQVAERLPCCVRDGDTVARLGGDEFVVMLEDLSANRAEAIGQAQIIGDKIIAALNQPYDLIGHKFCCTPSIGVALFADHQNSIDEVMKRADLAMYQAKAAGRNCLRFFDPEMQAVVSAHAALEEELRCALDEKQLVVYYQPQADCSGKWIGAEALVRWMHPVRGLVAPIEFIPLAEQTGLILPLGYWVLETACAQLVAWAANPATAHLSLAVNVSARQFRSPDFSQRVLAMLDRSGANPELLSLELTESLLLDDVEDTITKMTTLKERGVGFSLDDFGTGYSSLIYLKRLPLDQLKIDRSFVRDILTDPNDAAISRAIVALGQSLGMNVIAEGVETEAQRNFLSELGCHSFQGYFFSRPLPVGEFDRHGNFAGAEIVAARAVSPEI